MIPTPKSNNKDGPIIVRPAPGIIQPKDTRYFICPHGDLHIRKTVDSIWIERRGSWFARKYMVFIQWVGDSYYDLEWEEYTLAGAERVRDQLIATLIDQNDITSMV